MVKATCAPASRKRRQRVLKRARGFRGARSKLIRTAYDAVDRANSMAYVGRKLKKRQFRRLWTIRINAACRAHGLNYSRFMYGLKAVGIQLNRKVLADLALNEPKSFKELIAKAKSMLKKTELPSS